MKTFSDFKLQNYNDDLTFISMLKFGLTLKIFCYVNQQWVKASIPAFLGKTAIHIQ